MAKQATVKAKELAIEPSQATIKVGEKLQFTARHLENDVTQLVTWVVSNTTIAEIENGNDSAGMATGNSDGAVMVSAIYKLESGDEMSDTADLTVQPAPQPVLQSIVVSPSNVSVGVGETTQFTATGYDSRGNPTPIPGPVNWSSSNANAVIDQFGVATGKAVGQAKITASSGSVSGNTNLSVTPPVVSSLTISSRARPMETDTSQYLGSGETRQYTAVATYSDGTRKDVTSDNNTQWTSLNEDVATITSSGLATGIRSGRNKTTNISTQYTDPSTGTKGSGQVLLTVLATFTDLAKADSDAFDNAKTHANQLFTAFERRGNLSDGEINQLKDALELVTEFVNNNPDTPLPNFNAYGLAGQSDLSKLGITFNTDPSKPLGTGSGKANVIDDRFRAIAAYLFPTPPSPPGVEHDPGAFPGGNGGNPGGLTDDQFRIAAVYGRVLDTAAVPPQYKTIASLITGEDKTRRAAFNNVVEEANAHFGSNRDLYDKTLRRLLDTSQAPQIEVGIFAKVVDLLVKKGISPNNPQLDIEIDRALATAQNVGQPAQPSEINIDLPDLEQDVSNFEIIKENIFALQPAYFGAMLEELKVFQVVDKLVELFQNGILPVVKGDAGDLLFSYWKNAALRVSEAERRSFYERALGIPGGNADSPNREFKDLFLRFVSAVSSFVRQNTVDNLLRSNIPGAISQQQVRKAGRDLATNISSHGYGIAYPMATELQNEINQVMAILKNTEIQAAYGAKDLWQLVDQVAGLELGGAKNSVKYRTMASAGATVFAWLANKADDLSTNSYLPILDITQIQNPLSQSSKPTLTPSDFDLVGACDQWLAVTGTQEDSVEKMAQPTEAPAMPSRPIQIPAVARDMLEAVGMPPASLALAKGTNGQTHDKAKSWRY